MPEGFKDWQKDGHPSGDAIIKKAKNEGKLFSDGYREGALDMMIEGAEKVDTILSHDELKKKHSILYKKEGMSDNDVSTELENIRHAEMKTALEVLKEQGKQSELYKKFEEKSQIVDKQLGLIEKKVEELSSVSKERDIVKEKYSVDKRKRIDLRDRIMENKCSDLYGDEQIQEIMPRNMLSRLQLTLSKIPFLRSIMLESYALELAVKEEDNLSKENILNFEKLADLEEKIDGLYSTIEIEQKIFDEENSQLDAIIKKGKIEQAQLLNPRIQRLKALTGLNNKDSDNNEQSLN